LLIPVPKGILLILVLTLAMFHSSYAQCSGKKVYVELPSGWGSNTYVLLAGSFTRLTTTKEGVWTVFTFPTLTMDRSTEYIILSNINEHYNAAGIMYITRNTISTSQQLPGTNTNLLQCSNFSGPTTYISLNPENPSAVVISSEPPNSKYFYLLPPHTRNWIEGIPYIMNSSGNKTRMEIDPSGCGWYKATYFNQEPPEQMMIGIGPSMQNPIKGGIFNLAEKFEELGNIIYYKADGDEWLTSRSGILEQPDRCSYQMAAVIYDTDASVNTSFFDFDCTANGTGYVTDGSGILKGIVKDELDADRKMQWQGSGASTSGCGGGNDGWTQANFEKAFRSTPGANVVRCYDMPFARSKDNLWEFDSNKLCSDGTIDLDGTCDKTGKKFLGGFFPPELQTREGADYSLCANCDKQRPAQGWVSFRLNETNSLTTVSKWCYDRGYLGPASVTGEGLTSAQAAARCTRAFTNGDFQNGDKPIDFWDWEGTNTNGFMLRRDGRINGVTGSTVNSCSDPNNCIGATGTKTVGADMWTNKTMNKNQLFCFESHGTFKYDPAQEFFFSGDDDIWVFINNKLVIDLGGTHLAAPGYVDLSKLGLTEGEEYPIDIFFCDRKTTMSNVRIASNVYFAQTAASGAEAGLFLQTGETGKEICLQETANNCAALLAGTANTDPICGAELAQQISYYLVVPGTGNISLNSETTGCEWDTPTKGLCYGGISLDNGVVNIDEEAIPDYLKNLGFEIHAEVPHYSSLNISRTEPRAVVKRIALNVNFGVQNISARNFFAKAALPAGRDANIKVYSLNGSLISQHKLINGSANISVPNSGTYIFRLSGNGVAAKNALVVAK